MKTKIVIPMIIIGCLLAAPATAQVNYAVNGGAAYVTGSPGASGNIVIASTYNGFPVTRIKGGAFSGCTSLTSITIPNSVTSIESLVFYGCSSLTNLSVDAANPAYSSVDGVLFNKAQTTLITFPPGRGGSYAIPNGVASIENFAFSSCASLTSVTIQTASPASGMRRFRVAQALRICPWTPPIQPTAALMGLCLTMGKRP